MLLGDIYFEKGDFEKAFDEYEVAHALDKSKGLPYAKMGNVYLKLGKDKNALDAFQTAIDLDPNIPGIREKLDALLKQMNLQSVTDQNEQTATLYKTSSTKPYYTALHNGVVGGGGLEALRQCMGFSEASTPSLWV